MDRGSEVRYRRKTENERRERSKKERVGIWGGNNASCKTADCRIGNYV